MMTPAEKQALRERIRDLKLKLERSRSKREESNKRIERALATLRELART
jgi:hypothetical protein